LAFLNRLNFTPAFNTNTTAGSVFDYQTATTNDSTAFGVDCNSGTASNIPLRFDLHTAQTFTGTAATTTTTTGDLWANPGIIGNFSFSGIGQLKNALMNIFQKVPKKLIKTKEDKQMVIAKEKSEKLLKDWLSPAEYLGLINKGEIELSSEEEDVIYVIKKDPNAMVEVKKGGKHSHTLCAIAEDLEFPVGDQLLSKVLLLKTDEKKFKETAIRHG